MTQLDSSLPATNSLFVQAAPTTSSQTEERGEINTGNKVPKGGVDKLKRGPKISSQTEEQGAVPTVRAPSFMSCDLRDKPLEARAAHIAELRTLLKKIGIDPSSRAKAKLDALLYSLSILNSASL